MLLDLLFINVYRCYLYVLYIYNYVTILKCGTKHFQATLKETQTTLTTLTTNTNIQEIQLLQRIVITWHCILLLLNGAFGFTCIIRIHIYANNNYKETYLLC